MRTLQFIKMGIGTTKKQSYGVGKIDSKHVDVEKNY